MIKRTRYVNSLNQSLSVMKCDNQSSGLLLTSMERSLKKRYEPQYLIQVLFCEAGIIPIL